jgi:hypothetical protein
VNAEPTFGVTIFDDLSGETCTFEYLTAAALAGRIAATTASVKERLPLAKLAQFGTVRTENLSLRHNPNVIAVTGVEVDYDGEAIPFESAVERLEKEGIAAIVYTSPRHRLNGHADRWRVFCWFSQPRAPEERARYVDRLAGLFGDGKATVIASESRTLSQAFFIGAVAGNPEHRVEIVEGLPLDDSSFDDLDALALPWPGKSGNAAGNGALHEPSGDPWAPIADIEAALAVVPNDDLAWDQWNEIGMATWRSSDGSTAGLEAFKAFSAKSQKKYDEEETERRWRHYGTSKPTRIGYGSLVYRAREHDPDFVPPSHLEENAEPHLEENAEPHLEENEEPHLENEEPHLENEEPHLENEKSHRGNEEPGGGASSIWIDDTAWDEAGLPWRPWAVRGYALRGAVTIVAGPPSTMKSLLTLAWACALALGKAHGRFVPEERSTVIVYGVEDGPDEQRRRLSATLRQFSATSEDIAGRLTRVGPRGIGTLFKLNPKTGRLQSTPAMTQLRALIAERRPAVVICDPFVELHNAEERDNTVQHEVVAEFRTLAQDFNTAVVLVHHFRKGGMVSPGDVEAVRGATSIIGSARIVLTMTAMSETDAKRLGLPDGRKIRGRFFRLDDGKQNYARLDDARWYEAVTHTLDNEEMIAAAEPWEPPEIEEMIPADVGEAIVAEIDAGVDGGEPRSRKPYRKPYRRYPSVGCGRYGLSCGSDPSQNRSVRCG